MLPDVNQRIAVRVPGVEQELQSRVEDIVEQRLIIAVPTNGPAVHVLSIGCDLEIEWITARGLARLPGAVRRHLNNAIPSLVVDIVGQTELFQRRDYARAHAMLDIRVEPAFIEGPPVYGTSLDISGGGLRAKVPLSIAPGEPVTIDVEMPDGKLSVGARVCRQVEIDSVAFEFTEISQADRERIIRYVFASHRRGVQVEMRKVAR